MTVVNTETPTPLRKVHKLVKGMNTFQILMLFFFTAAAMAQRAIPEDNLAYPMLAELDLGDGKVSAGSGFFYDYGTNVYFVTARHVLIATENLSNVVRFNLIATNMLVSGYAVGGGGKLRARIALSEGRHLINWHNQRDVAVVQFGRVENSKMLRWNSFVQVAEMPTGALITCAETNIKVFHDVLIGNEVVMFGYPTSLGIKDMFFDPRVPLLRSGIVAGKDQRKWIVLDCPVFKGNSGSPVVERSTIGFGYNVRVIGVVSRFVPFVEEWKNVQMEYVNHNVSNSGYSIVEPMDFVVEVIKELENRLITRSNP